MASTAPTIDDIAGRTLLFRVGSVVYGCDIRAIREIVPYRRATRLPGAPPYVQGLINVRGTIVTVLDVGARLEPGRAPATDGSIIMVEYGTRTVGLVVEEVMDVRVLSFDSDGAADAPKDTIVHGVGRVETTVVVALDVRALIKQVLLT